MKWFLSFVLMGVVCSIVYIVVLGLALMAIENAIGRHSLILETLQKVCAVAIGFYTSYKLWPPRQRVTDQKPSKSDDTAKDKAEPCLQTSDDQRRPQTTEMTPSVGNTQGVPSPITPGVAAGTTPNDVAVIMDRGPSFVSGSLQGIAVFLNAVVQAAPAAIDRHVRMMTQHEDDPAVARNLQCVLDSLDLVKTIIREKAAQCMHDDRGHSKLFVRKDGDPIIAVSCWNCTLQELRTHFEAEIGPYAGMLERYAQQTIQAGASCYIHIFYCFTTEKVGTTVCYLDVVERKCIKPNELM